jgi:hypothetical protein
MTLTSETRAPVGAETPPDSWFDTYTRAAHRAAKLPKNWIGYLFEAVQGQGVMVTGRVVTQTITRGPRKGEPNFRTADPKTERKVFVSNKAAEAERRREIKARSKPLLPANESQNEGAADRKVLSGQNVSLSTSAGQSTNDSATKGEPL